VREGIVLKRMIIMIIMVIIRKCEEAREEIVLESRNKFVYCRQCDLASFR